MKDYSEVLRAAEKARADAAAAAKPPEPEAPPVNYGALFTPGRLAVDVPQLPGAVPYSAFRVAHTDATIRVLDLGRKVLTEGIIDNIFLPRIGWLLELWAHATKPVRYSVRINVVSMPMVLPWSAADEWVRVWHDTKAIRAAMLRQKMPRYALMQEAYVEAAIRYEVSTTCGAQPSVDYVEAYMVCREVLPEDRKP